MNIAGIVYTILSGNSDVNTKSGGKIYPQTIPQAVTPPFVRYLTVSVDPNDTKTGPSDMDAIRVQVDAYAADTDAAMDLGRAIRVALDRYKGNTTVVAEANKVYYVDGIRFITWNDVTEPEKDLFRFSADYVVRVNPYT